MLFEPNGFADPAAQTVAVVSLAEGTRSGKAKTGSRRKPIAHLATKCREERTGNPQPVVVNIAKFLWLEEFLRFVEAERGVAGTRIVLQVSAPCACACHSGPRVHRLRSASNGRAHGDGTALPVHQQTSYERGTHAPSRAAGYSAGMFSSAFLLNPTVLGGAPGNRAIQTQTDVRGLENPKSLSVAYGRGGVQLGARVGSAAGPSWV